MNTREYARKRGVPANLVKAFKRLSLAIGDPDSLMSTRDTIEEALIDEAIRQLEELKKLILENELKK